MNDFFFFFLTIIHIEKIYLYYIFFFKSSLSLLLLFLHIYSRFPLVGFRNFLSQGSDPRSDNLYKDFVWLRVCVVGLKGWMVMINIGPKPPYLLVCFCSIVTKAFCSLKIIRILPWSWTVKNRDPHSNMYIFFCYFCSLVFVRVLFKFCGRWYSPPSKFSDPLSRPPRGKLEPFFCFFYGVFFL